MTNGDLICWGEMCAIEDLDAEASLDKKETDTATVDQDKKETDTATVDQDTGPEAETADGDMKAWRLERFTTHVLPHTSDRDGVDLHLCANVSVFWYKSYLQFTSHFGYSFALKML